jgi:hypothetical protein
MPGGLMVWLGGPHRRGIRGRGIYLQDPPPGYHPPHGPKLPLKERQREAREEYILMRVTSIVLVLAATAFMVIIVVIIATHV